MNSPPVFLFPVLLAVAPAQDASWIEDLGSSEPVVRETARRKLALAKKLPVDELLEVVKRGKPAAAVAAASLLRDRHPELPALRHIPVGDTPLFRAVLSVASDATVRQVFGSGSGALRARALFLLEDRKQLTDAMLLQALTGPSEELAEAACRLIVLERSPFPLEIAQRLAGDAKARLRLVTWLADRPRRRAGPFVARILAADKLPLRIRILAVNALPSSNIDLEIAKLVLGAAAGKDLAVGNRARDAAARLDPKIADKLIPEVVLRVQAGTPVYLLLPCLERISADGERLLLEHARRASGGLQSDIFHWLSTRDSKLIDKYVGRALDSNKPFPVDLLRLVSPALTSKARIDFVASLLRAEEGGPLAYAALLDAEVYHPSMLEYAVADEFAQQARRLRRLLEMPLAKLPVEVFESAFKRESLIAWIYAVNALARGPIPKSLERQVIDYAESTINEQLQVNSARALLLWGSEVAGRRAWAALRKAERTDLGFRWLLERPRPWSYEILLKERERLAAVRSKAGVAGFHRVLIALAQLGDRGAKEQLVREIPRLAPVAMRLFQKLMGRSLRKRDLQALADKYLDVRQSDPQQEQDFSAEDDRRVELLEWILADKRLDVVPLMEKLWKQDRAYEVRLVALRGLLARDSVDLHAQVRRQLAGPFDDGRQELAFELIGSMTELPITARSLELLAHILLRCPLTVPDREVTFSLAKNYSTARRDYPLITPAVNLLRMDEAAKPREMFAKVVAQIGDNRYALNRQRLGLFLAGISRRVELIDDLGPVVARLILSAPDTSEDFVGPAEMVLAEAADAAGDYTRAAELYEAAVRAFSRGVVPAAIQRMFLGVVDPVARYHPIAAFAARAPIARAKALIGDGKLDAAAAELLRARDLAEGDADTIDEITDLQKTTGR